MAVSHIVANPMKMILLIRRLDRLVIIAKRRCIFQESAPGTGNAKRVSEFAKGKKQRSLRNLPPAAGTQGLALRWPRYLTCRQPATRCLSSWHCETCKWRKRPTTSTPLPRRLKPLQHDVDGETLLKAIDVKLRLCGSYYSTEMREKLRSEIAIRILRQHTVLGHRLTIKTLTPATIRTVAKCVFRTQSIRFREVNLDHTYSEDGYKLEERLAG